MRETPEERLLSSIRKAAGFVTRGIVTGPEFVNAVRDELAHADAVYPAALSPLWEAVPDIIRGECSSAIRASSRPGFLWRPFFIGTGPPPADDELRRGTERIRAWSVELLRLIEGIPVRPV